MLSLEGSVGYVGANEPAAGGLVGNRIHDDAAFGLGEAPEFAHVPGAAAAANAETLDVPDVAAESLGVDPVIGGKGRDQRRPLPLQGLPSPFLGLVLAVTGHLQSASKSSCHRVCLQRANGRVMLRLAMDPIMRGKDRRQQSGLALRVVPGAAVADVEELHFGSAKWASLTLSRAGQAGALVRPMRAGWGKDTGPFGAGGRRRRNGDYLVGGMGIFTLTLAFSHEGRGDIRWGKSRFSAHNRSFRLI